MDIKEVLTKLNSIMTDTAIAGRLGVAQSTISRLRSGKRISPSFKLGVAITALASENNIQ